MKKITKCLFSASIGVALCFPGIAAENKQKADALVAVINHQAITDQRINDAYLVGGYYLTGLSIIVGLATLLVAYGAIALPFILSRAKKDIERDSEKAEAIREKFEDKAERKFAEIDKRIEQYDGHLEVLGNTIPSNRLPSIETKPPTLQFGASSDPKEDLLYKGNKAHAERQYDVAITFYNELLALDSNFSVAYNNIGLSYAKLGKYDEALKYYDQAISKDAYNIQAKYNKAEVLFVQKTYDAALKCFDEILQIRQDANIYNYKGLIYEKQDDFERSLACYRKAYELAPNILIYKQNILGALLLNKQADAAVPLIKELELTVPSSWSAKLLGHIELLNNNLEEAEKFYNLALSRIDGTKEKLAALNLILESDLKSGKKALPDKNEAITFLADWVNRHINELTNI